ncbi:MAG TPA: TOBE domain-containing protein, partial [Rhodopila sp.]|nr:TOBE domain-containing protein [Rhodopila sp.]
DEPLANLDYKLREELREQLPRIFAESNAILVYATTEPTEALLLGGHTATVWEGQVTQHGPTSDVYRQPRNIAAARVFSDPPLNELAVTKRGSAVTTAAGRSLPAQGILADLPDGEYRIGFRCDDARLDAAADDAFSFPGTVSVTELSGTESFVHVDVGVGTWVCLVRGVHDWQPGARTHVRVDMRRALAFDGAGTRVTQAAPQLERAQA